ncbi:GNAT family N-acetyltransferase [Pseudomonas rubra]|uniref:GNAT family N-acetyltransferase n=1 Tax=Pseudomonas rubra TaxID=2942627 RepID=A0ABT5P913_9PSED|nr:GNAT family N-acetyltransferase [Pseudomonas rubra]MDD1014494.1 GNAT family N-acetyltransferase [Pseudomonas rubra]MDD1037883.1 GNAT family N-acetyltransferase [Pseudomonas rubra]MDD1155316.1 GNAT family N-acetyltransferase [Pseudomonas rubra]
MQLTDHRDLTPAQREQLLEIQLLPGQQRYAGDMTCALYTLFSSDSPDIRGVALLVENVPQAFLLLQRGAFLPCWARIDAAIINALQVDRRRQGHGLGRFCMQALPDLVRSLWPEVRCLQLSVDPDNHAALALYRGTGWVDSGDGFRARKGYECQLTLAL